MADILVFCEFADGKIKASARELLGKAKEFGGTVTGVVLGSRDTQREPFQGTVPPVEF